MNTTEERQYLKTLGARVLSEANDLKRTPEALAAELSIDPDVVQAVIQGRADAKSAETVVRVMADRYPISLADILVVRDDTRSGVKFMRSRESAKTSRVFDRATRHGELTPYYEYRDTAMSRTAPFKPEWIQPIRVVGDDEPDNPDVAYNNGHFMHQCTFFIGEVNFYWRIGNRGYSAEMNTGDSNYITPFVPHSFTSRNSDRPGLILAVTYAGQVRHAIDEFGRIGDDAAAALAGRPVDDNHAFAARLARHLDAESLSREELIERLEANGMSRTRAEAVVEARVRADATEIRVLADTLNLRVEDLTVTPLGAVEPVTVCLARDGHWRPYPKSNAPACRIRELARNRRQPGLRGFDVTVLGNNQAAEKPFRHGRHQYVYNYGTGPVTVTWRDDGDNLSDVLEPGDSAYIRPMVAHTFSAATDGGEGRLVVIRIPGSLTDATIEEFASFAPAGRHRVVEENKRWF